MQDEDDEVWRLVVVPAAGCSREVVGSEEAGPAALQVETRLRQRVDGTKIPSAGIRTGSLLSGCRAKGVYKRKA